jgi:hypothetical protein
MRDAHTTQVIANERHTYNIELVCEPRVDKFCLCIFVLNDILFFLTVDESSPAPIADWSEEMNAEDNRQSGYYTDSILTGRGPRGGGGYRPRGRGGRYPRGSGYSSNRSSGKKQISVCVCLTSW